MGGIEVIIPWAGEEPHRLAARGWVLDRYAERHPDWMLTLASEYGRYEIGHKIAPKVTPWVKALAVNPAVAASTADILIIGDADCYTDGVDEAVSVVASGRFEWAVPQVRTHRFTADYTARVLDGADPNEHTAVSLQERAYFSPAGGGLIVAARHSVTDVILDPRFEGWGGEDRSWGWALETLHGKSWRGGWPLWHLWHPPQDRPSRVVLPPANDTLSRRYYSARGKPARMRALIDEAKEVAR